MHSLLFSAAERGLTQTDWLQSYHTFSFGDYYDPHKMQYGVLRVFNDDIIAPGAGFPPHPHDNMEIVTIVLMGSLEHRDNMGNRGVIREWDVQRMSAGKGVRHAEYNASKEHSTHILQIWVTPNALGLAPSYEQKSFSPEVLKNRFCTLVSSDGAQGSLHIHQQATFKRGLFDKGTPVELRLTPNQGLFLFVAMGEVEVAGTVLRAGDGIGLSEIDKVPLQIKQKSDLIAIEIPL